MEPIVWFPGQVFTTLTGFVVGYVLYKHAFKPFAAVVSYHLLIVYALASHRSLSLVNWRTFAALFVKDWLQFTFGQYGVPNSISTDLFTWRGVFSWELHKESSNDEE